MIVHVIAPEAVAVFDMAGYFIIGIIYPALSPKNWREPIQLWLLDLHEDVEAAPLFAGTYDGILFNRFYVAVRVGRYVTKI